MDCVDVVESYAVQPGKIMLTRLVTALRGIGNNNTDLYYSFIKQPMQLASHECRGSGDYHDTVVGI